jgi:hypothetical protein
VIVANSSNGTAKVDNASVSGESSNSRNSISKSSASACSSSGLIFISSSTVTTDSQTSEEDGLVPPPLPVKHRDSDFGNMSLDDAHYSRTPSNRTSTGSDLYHFVNRPLPATPTHGSDDFITNSSHYEVLEIRNREVISSTELKMGKKFAPVPPPKPSRTSSKNNLPMSP